MGFLVDHATYTRTYDDPAGGDGKLEVVLRPLDAGDRAQVEDTIALEFSDEEGSETARPSIRVGSMKLLMVERAVVSWSLDVSPTAETVRRLNPTVLDLIFADVQYGSAPGDAGDPLSEASVPDVAGSS